MKKFKTNNQNTKGNYQELIAKFSNQKIAVIGDLILDKYIYGDVKRISPEAPVPIVRVTNEKYVPGGAANVAVNVNTLSGMPFLLGVVGDDSYQEILLKKIGDIDSNGILCVTSKETIRKTRIVGLNQQLLRIDHEDRDNIESHFEDRFMEILKNIIDLNAIIVADYAKGMITENLMQQLITFSASEHIPIIIDPKPQHKNWYKGSSLITPNQNEAAQMSGITIETEKDYIKAGEKLIEELSANIIITAGADGMYIFEKGKKPQHLPTVAREVYDVSGAGDTVVSALTLALSSGASIMQAAELANRAAGIKVGKVGTQPVHLEELINAH